MSSSFHCSRNFNFVLALFFKKNTPSINKRFCIFSIEFHPRNSATYLLNKAGCFGLSQFATYRATGSSLGSFREPLWQSGHIRDIKSRVWDQFSNQWLIHVFYEQVMSVLNYFCQTVQLRLTGLGPNVSPL